MCSIASKGRVTLLLLVLLAAPVGAQDPPPHRFDIVQRLASERPDLLQINTHVSIGEFTRLVVAVLAADDPGWGFVGKTAGESQVPLDGLPREIAGWWITGVSHDVIFHQPSNRQVDIVRNATANEPCPLPPPDCWAPGPGEASWDLIPPEFHRPNNPWVPAVVSAPPAPVPPPPDLGVILTRLNEIEAWLLRLQADVTGLGQQLQAHDARIDRVQAGLDLLAARPVYARCTVRLFGIPLSCRLDP
jgi:hypothetical protein